MDIDDHFVSAIQKDLLQLCIGAKIGSGMSRDVFEWIPDTSLVAKVEARPGYFQNIVEWETWRNVEEVPTVRKWFAPCVQISPCGIILLQKRTKITDRFPDKLPAYLTDTKESNYGRLKGKFVCHDYGTHTMLEFGMTKRLRKATWHQHI